ncbi:hypothetical protein SLNWT_4380 [Streptomyces albus]|uniref:Uncharacterized protein n=1 Tax=Streptomyces albus (strain ATCC 21838 / DSM 41398 / FERM P-419 / JCM 4703 / NBRC 107858) TaxID=1081613 RepID=A0A0B5F1K0_STRA4|nr:hypothetical protein SLNWT_4380 [Streptomyces albus]AOU79062.1 hypothetical protein SLNHY_4371 [Streptomyces albus]AYN34795.1 hypothetical protein DUI70_4296 [Streptomyces albus]
MDSQGPVPFCCLVRTCARQRGPVTSLPYLIIDAFLTGFGSERTTGRDPLADTASWALQLCAYGCSSALQAAANRAPSVVRAGRLDSSPLREGQQGQRCLHTPTPLPVASPARRRGAARGSS